jgi:HEAT repeat protein
MTDTKQGKSSLRRTTLVLLWVWAITVFMVVDLFLDVSEFDAIRPRARLYLGMRAAAHRMVDATYEQDDPIRFAGRAHDPAGLLADAMADVKTLNSPDALRERARYAVDPRVRIAAMGELARRFPLDGIAVLQSRLREDRELLKVRRHAARLLGHTGRGAEASLELVLESELPHGVRGGAVLGLGELGTSSATNLLLALADEQPFRETALEAIARISNAEAAPLLREAALSPERREATRRAACRALWRMNEPATVETLSLVLRDTQIPAAVRAMAADSLGRLGNRNALAVVTAATSDDDPDVARMARLAQTRLAHVQ